MSVCNRGQAEYRGFTLIEVLIALTIFALCAAVFTAQSTSTLSNRNRIVQQQLALWVAKNKLAELRIGIINSDITSQLQGPGKSWEIKSTVDATALPRLKKITIQVTPSNQVKSADYSVAELVGYIAVAP
ncbi:type II secretion system minor pseudopilin GspI [SAR92 clade bacterium H231]|nr:type II secretion system minor pseudopilin GspI [SAR92 clade bacterium H231]